MADLLETPSRLLKRVQQYEDMDLPSLPSISHDVDCDQTTEYPDPEDSVLSGNEEWSTPQVGRPFPSPPNRQSHSVRERTSLVVSSNLLDANESFSEFRSSPRNQLSDEEPSFLADLSRSRNTPNKSIVPQANESDFWDDSMDSKRLPAASLERESTLGPSDDSLQASSMDTSTTSMMDTPLPRHFQRNPAPAAYTVAATDTRIPSLTRSEVSGTDQEATTPEGHDRLLNPPVSTDPGTAGDVTAEASDHDHTHHFGDSISKSTPASSQTVTPAVIRYMDTPSTAARAAATPFGFGAALRDVTRRHTNYSNVPSTPFTPTVDYNKTPRAALDDAERRKNHVLSVLASSALPSRSKRFTPNPRRHVSVVLEANSTSEEPSFLSPVVEDNRSVNESFISVASSQDLTPERRGSRAFSQRANTSVPNILYSGAMASPGVSHLDNRPDTVKIQKHLNMMNQQLLDNNADLAREAEEWRTECTRLIGIMRETGIQIDDDGNILGEIPKVHHDQSLELPGVSEQSTSSCSSVDEATQKQVAELQDQLREKDKKLVELLDMSRKGSPAGSRPDSERVASLEQELEASREAHNALKLEFAQKTKDHTAQFAEICTEFEEQVRRLQIQVRQQEDELANLRRAAASASAENNRKEVEIDQLQERLHQQERSLSAATEDVSRLHKQASEYLDELQLHKMQTSEMEGRLQAAVDSYECTKRAADELEKARSSAVAERDAALEEVDELRRRVEDLERLASTHRGMMEEQRETLKRLEDLTDREHRDLEETQRLLKDAQKDLNEIEDKLSAKEQEIEALRSQAEIAVLEKTMIMDDTNPTEAENSIILALEERLEAAHKEIGKLKHNAQASPFQRSALESRDARISALETEKLSLMERLKAQEVSSPVRWSNSMMTSTPLHKTVTSLKFPTTPGPLKDISWLQSTFSESNESMLRAQLEHLHQELDVANSQLDRNFGRLEEAGYGAVELAEKLAVARDRIATLEGEIQPLAHESKKSVESLRAGQNRNEGLENALEAVREQMAILKDDMSHEKERLQDDNRRLRVILADVQSKADEEIEALGVEIARVHREAEDQFTEYQERLQAMRVDGDNVDSKIRSLRGTIQALETELSSARGAAAEVESQKAVIRNQSADLSSQRVVIESLRSSLAEVRLSKDSLHDELRARTQELETAQSVKEDLESEHFRLTRDLVDFSNDLSTQKRECAKFALELETLRVTQAATRSSRDDKLASVTKELSLYRERLLFSGEEANEAKKQCADLSRDLATLESVLRDTTSEQRQRYKLQTRRLSAQIEYLKAKYTRENTFRNALALQKKFLLLLVGGMSLTEQATLKAIASMGVERPSAPVQPRRRLKSVAIAVLSVIRAKRIAKEWRTTREVRAVGTARE